MEPTAIPVIARIRGWLLIVLGACLSVGMVGLSIYMASVISHNDQAGGVHWTGNHQMTARVFELFGTIFAFGVVSIASGIFQLRRGRASWTAMIVLFVLVAILYFLGQDIMRMGR